MKKSAKSMLATRWLPIALWTIAINAVLIQTILPDDSLVKSYVRFAVLAVTLIVAFADRIRYPRWLISLSWASGTLYLLTLNSDLLTVIFLLLFTPLLASLPHRLVMRHAMIASWVAMASILVLMAVGLTQNRLIVTATYLTADRARYNFGTASIPFLMNVVFGATALTIFYVYRYRIRGRAIYALCCVAVMAYFFVASDGRGGALALLLFIVIAVFLKLFRRIPGVRQIVCLQPVLYGASVLAIALLRNNADANQLLSFRPDLYGRYLDSVTLWQVLTSTSVKSTTVVQAVDSSYIHLLVGGGLLTYFCFSIAFGRAVSRLIKSGQILEVAFISAVMAYAASESILLRAENIFVIVVWYLVVRGASTIYELDQSLVYRSPSVNYAASSSRINGQAPFASFPSEYGCPSSLETSNRTSK